MSGEKFIVTKITCEKIGGERGIQTNDQIMLIGSGTSNRIHTNDCWKGF